jgi:hypothetical protein
MEKYNVSLELLQRIKKAAKYAGLRWEPIAARPEQADAFCRKVEDQIRQDDLDAKLIAMYDRRPL